MSAVLPLAELLGELVTDRWGEESVAITGIAYDSRSVEPGNVFVAVPGFRFDGAVFVPEAVARGAAAVVAECGAPAAGPRPACWLRVRDARRALASLACAWYGDPSRRLRVVGVTGTNGKTTVAALLQEMLASAAPCGRWSTTRVVIGEEEFSPPRTTPEAVDLQAALRRMLEAGCAAAVVEVSSHALRLQRVAGTAFDAAVCTNLSPDHLDFHADMDDYLDAKAELFRMLPADAPAVINFSDPAAPRLAAATRGRVVGYGWESATSAPLACALVGIDDIAQGTRIRLRLSGRMLDLRARLFGRANAENIAAAVAAATALGVAPDRCAEIVAGFRGEPGRLEAIDEGQPFAVLVDFAHTPAALEAAIEAARRRVRGGALTVLFGCGGDRDRGKRPLMGGVAAAGADRVIVTSDNPRSEDPLAIIDEILAGIPARACKRVQVEPDRRRAIERALARAAPGDCVLVAGKGHETEQLFADRSIAFDDRQVVRELLHRRRAEVERCCR